MTRRALLPSFFLLWITSYHSGQEDGWVSVFGQNEKGKWVEVVEEQVQLDKPTQVLFI